MKKIALLIASLFFLFSCEIDDDFPKTENITSGKKWTLQIGSSPIDVYRQLQELGIEKNFHDVSIPYRQPFSNPTEIKSDISLYHAITLERTLGVTQRILIRFNQNKVSAIEIGGALLDAIPKWPENVSDKIAIHVNDPLGEIYKKLLAIYKNPIYEKYQIVLSNKWLEKDFDPDMMNYNVWHFTFSHAINSTRAGNSSVSLFFKKDKLFKIRHEYNEDDIVN